MDIRVLGCHGSRTPGQRTSCLLVNERIALDAGSITGVLEIEEQLNIDHVLLTHAHLDHCFDLPFLADNVMAQRQSPLRIWAPAPVLDVLRAHLFNGQIWPDLGTIEVHGFPVVEFCPLPPGQTTRVGDVDVAWERTNHTVYSAGYLLAQDGVSVLFTGDTTTTQDLWAMARTRQDLAALFVETAFPNRLAELALATGHLTPALLVEELKKLDNSDLPVKIFHMKSPYLDEIRSELAEMCGCCEILNGNERYRF